MRFAVLLSATFVCLNAEKLLTKSEMSLSAKYFSSSLLKQLNYKEDNILYSPIGLAMVTGMVMAGANNETKSQICNVLHINEYKDKVEQFHQLCREILNDYKSMHSRGQNATIEMANLVLTSNKLHIPESFENTLKNQYDAAFEKENFEMQEQVKEKINKFVKERTHDIIPQILSEPLNPNTVLALISTIYFKAFWAEKMDEGSELTFYNSDKSESKVKMLTMDPVELNFADSKEHKCKMLELPYNGNVSMFIYLPYERYGLAKLIENYNPEEARSVLSEAKKTLVNLNLPKFEYDYEIDLNEVFPKMGFNLKNSLQGIDSRLKVDKALHKAKIRNDEAGTEAAAATIVDAVPESATIYDPPPIQFDVTHPFIYAIHEKESQTALFIGVVNKLP